MPAFLQDVRFAVRTLAKTPGFTLAVVLTIALGVGATTAMWTVVDRIVLRPLPFPGSERAVMLCETSARTAAFCVASPPNAADWAASVPALESVGVARTESFVAVMNGSPFGVRGAIATPGFFSAIGLAPAAGRVLEAADLDRARNNVAVISDKFWRERLNADPMTVGRSIVLDGKDTRVVGVLPAKAYVPNYDGIDIWKPLTAGIDNPDVRARRGFMTIGRLAPGATLSTLNSQLEVVRARLERAYPESNAGWGVRTVPVRDYVVGPAGRTLWLFLGAVAFVMLIACANVASLLLLRASTRAPEFAVRVSLGAGRGRLVRQMLTESLVLAAAGGAAGLLLAMYITRALIALAPADLPRVDEIGVDARVAVFAVALASLAAFLFGLAPAREASRTRLTGSLGASRHTGRGCARARALLVVVELSLAMVLLVGAGLLTRAFGRLAAWDPGFDRAGVTVSFSIVPQSVFKTPQEAVGALERVRDEVAAVPGVVSVGLASAGPLFGGGPETGTLSIAGRPAVPDDAAPVVNWYDADANYFGALGRRIVRGRGMTTDDAAGAAPVAIVNEAFAARFFAAEDPIGRRVVVQNHPADIVGVVSDVRPFQPDQPVPAEIFWPIRQYPRFAAYLVMRLSPGAAGVEEAVKARVRAIHPNIQVSAFVPIDRIVSRTLVSPRFYMALIGVFAILAVTLAAVGVYGVTASAVASRTKELGLRIALGATPRQLVFGVTIRALALAAAGLTIGLVAALLLGRLLTALLHGVPVTDTLTLVVTVALFVAITALAGFLPARRASRVDPLAALRDD
jgi:putative ABC transport system permease protein